MGPAESRNEVREDGRRGVVGRERGREREVERLEALVDSIVGVWMVVVFEFDCLYKVVLAISVSVKKSRVGAGGYPDPRRPMVVRSTSR